MAALTALDAKAECRQILSSTRAVDHTYLEASHLIKIPPDEPVPLCSVGSWAALSRPLVVTAGTSHTARYLVWIPAVVQITSESWRRRPNVTRRWWRRWSVIFLGR